MRNPHILRTLVNFFLFLVFDFFSEIIITPSKCSEPIQTISKRCEVPDFFLKVHRSGEWEGYEQCEESSHSSCPV